MTDDSKTGSRSTVLEAPTDVNDINPSRGTGQTPLRGKTGNESLGTSRNDGHQQPPSGPRRTGGPWSARPPALSHPLGLRRRPRAGRDRLASGGHRGRRGGRRRHRRGDRRRGGRPGRRRSLARRSAASPAASPARDRRGGQPHRGGRLLARQLRQPALCPGQELRRAAPGLRVRLEFARRAPRPPLERGGDRHPARLGDAKDKSRLGWHEAKGAVQDAWNRVDSRIGETPDEARHEPRRVHRYDR